MGVGDIHVTVRLFASLRERAGTDRLPIEVPAATPVGAVWSHLPEEVRGAAPPEGLRYALNHVVVDPRRAPARRRRGRAGAPGVGRMIALTDDPLDLAPLLAAVADPEHGGTGDVHRHDAPRGGRARGGRPELRGLRGARARRDGGHRRRGPRGVRRHGRAGPPRGPRRCRRAERDGARRPPGHRPAAFAACRFAIDELKARVPVWKQTVYEDGATDLDRRLRRTRPAPGRVARRA